MRQVTNNIRIELDRSPACFACDEMIHGHLCVEVAAARASQSIHLVSVLTLNTESVPTPRVTITPSERAWAPNTTYRYPFSIQAPHGPISQVVCSSKLMWSLRAYIGPSKFFGIVAEQGFLLTAPTALSETLTAQDYLFGALKVELGVKRHFRTRLIGSVVVIMIGLSFLALLFDRHVWPGGLLGGSIFLGLGLHILWEVWKDWRFDVSLQPFLDVKPCVVRSGGRLQVSASCRAQAQGVLEDVSLILRCTESYRHGKSSTTNVIFESKRSLMSGQKLSEGQPVRWTEPLDLPDNALSSLYFYAFDRVWTLELSVKQPHQNRPRALVYRFLVLPVAAPVVSPHALIPSVSPPPACELPPPPRAVVSPQTLIPSVSPRTQSFAPNAPLAFRLLGYLVFAVATFFCVMIVWKHPNKFELEYRPDSSAVHAGLSWVIASVGALAFSQSARVISWYSGIVAVGCFIKAGHFALNDANIYVNTPPHRYHPTQYIVSWLILGVLCALVVAGLLLARRKYRLSPAR